ncbi:hypothetical protein A2U01_0073164, partial [Trifolium medium]|nr:hypothetical protein [Trifolium medium]
MKRRTSKANVDEKKKSEKGTSASNQSKVQKKLKFKQEVSSDSGKTDFGWAEFLEAYNPSAEDADSEEEVTQKLLKTK